MFSYLRPHRRIPSTPSSPNPEVPSFEPPARPGDHGHPLRRQDSKYEDDASPITSQPVLRVASAGYGNTYENSKFLGKTTTHGHDPRGQGLDTRVDNVQKRSLEFGSSQKSLLYANNQRPGSAGNSGQGSSRNTAFDHSRSQSTVNSDTSTKQFSGPMTPDSDVKPTGRRPTGARIPSPTIEALPSHSSKGRLKMLNPMALLARRRTSQAIPQLIPESLTTSFDSNDYDPRIKGTVVHDFSAPRGSRRNVSHNDVHSADATRSFRRTPHTDSMPSEKAGNHTPVFTENFEEEQYPAAGLHVRKANDLSDLTAPKLPYAREISKPVDHGSSSKDNDEFQAGDLWRLSAQKSSLYVGSLVSPIAEDSVPVESKRISIDPASTPPKDNSSTRKNGRPFSEVSANHIPKHMKSTSSRFSFDMIGAAEQERLLEDRHRQKALEKKSDSNNGDQEYYDEDEDFNYDDMMDDDGLEEKIPGVNADYEDDTFDGFDGGYEEEMPGINTNSLEDITEAEEHQEIEQRAPVEDKVQPGLLDGNVVAFTFQPHVSSPMSPCTPGTTSTPRDSDGQVIGFATTKYSPHLPVDPQNSVFTPVSPDDNVLTMNNQLPDLQTIPEAKPQGLGIVTENSIGLQDEGIQQQSYKFTPLPPLRGLDDDLYFDDGLIGLEGAGIVTESSQESPEEIIQQQSYKFTSLPPLRGLDDDLYFDDGLIGLEGQGDLDGDEIAGDFDESIFDNNDTDQYGRPIKDQFMTAQISKGSKANGERSLEDGKKDALSPLSPTVGRQIGGIAPQPSFSENRMPTTEPTQMTTQSLTQDKLAAYQASLAEAAMIAAANGKFRRDSTQSLFHLKSDREEHQPGLITDSGHTSSHYDQLSPSYDDDFDYDDALEDDEFIAAANAEALANDQDGFYGQEFGFYSQPAASSAEYTNGGYFGPRGMDGMIRSQSGRIASREPNLTPITERSEYSNRNSFMSVSHLHAATSGTSPLVSPGLAQLMMTGAGMGDWERMGAPDLSLDALLKLRSRAWGGSQASVKSAGSGGGGNGNGNENTSPKSVDGGAGNGSPVAGAPIGTG